MIARSMEVARKRNQGEPGQLGELCRGMAAADVDIEVLYTDHANRLVLVADDFDRGLTVGEQWTRDSERGK